MPPPLPPFAVVILPPPPPPLAAFAAAAAGDCRWSCRCCRRLPFAAAVLPPFAAVGNCRCRHCRLLLPFIIYLLFAVLLPLFCRRRCCRCFAIAICHLPFCRRLPLPPFAAAAIAIYCDYYCFIILPPPFIAAIIIIAILFAAAAIIAIGLLLLLLLFAVLLLGKYRCRCFAAVLLLGREIAAVILPLLPLLPFAAGVLPFIAAVLLPLFIAIIAVLLPFCCRLPSLHSFCICRRGAGAAVCCHLSSICRRRGVSLPS